jgi:hypothetical protein
MKSSMACRGKHERQTLLLLVHAVAFRLFDLGGTGTILPDEVKDMLHLIFNGGAKLGLSSDIIDLVVQHVRPPHLRVECCLNTWASHSARRLPAKSWLAARGFSALQCSQQKLR